MSNNNNAQSTKVEIIHPIFKNVKNIGLVKQSQNLLVLKMRTQGYSYNSISRRLFAEHKISITPQRVGQIIDRFGEDYGRYQV